MVLTKKEQKTIAYYDKYAQKWAEAHAGFEEVSFWKKEMLKLKKLLPDGKILEIGSGSGKDAGNLVKLGYEYVGTDISKGLLEIARGRNPQVDFKNISIYDLKNSFDRHFFDGFWTVATLLHIAKDRIDEALENIHTVVRNGGYGFISIKQGGGEKEDETGRTFSYYEMEEFAKILKRNGFEVLETDIQPMSERTIWLKYFVRVV